ncbi:MAG TPA: NAD(P)H-dependent dehydrogenase/reductase [Firmicutes bacterium]|jgi:nitroreductase|nr:NAD(P)H-dependent dehydrogenase/reductase [Bacillota bacterium]
MVLSLIQKRRSIRKYFKKSIEPEKLKALIEAALRSPSSRALYPWEFIVVDQPDMLQKLAVSKNYGSSFLKDAVLAMVICADSKRSDIWIEDAAIAGTYIQLTAQSLGLGSCWIQIRERMHDDHQTAEEFIRNVMEIPERLKVDSIIAIGYPDEAPPAHSEDELQYEKVFYNRYGNRK